MPKVHFLQRAFLVRTRFPELAGTSAAGQKMLKSGEFRGQIKKQSCVQLWPWLLVITGYKWDKKHSINGVFLVLITGISGLNCSDASEIVKEFIQNSRCQAPVSHENGTTEQPQRLKTTMLYPKYQRPELLNLWNHNFPPMICLAANIWMCIYIYIHIPTYICFYMYM